MGEVSRALADEAKDATPDSPVVLNLNVVLPYMQYRKKLRFFNGMYTPSNKSRLFLMLLVIFVLWTFESGFIKRTTKSYDFGVVLSLSYSFPDGWTPGSANAVILNVITYALMIFILTMVAVHVNRYDPFLQALGVVCVVLFAVVLSRRTHQMSDVAQDGKATGGSFFLTQDLVMQIFIWVGLLHMAVLFVARLLMPMAVRRNWLLFRCKITQRRDLTDPAAVASLIDFPPGYSLTSERRLVACYIRYITPWFAPMMGHYESVTYVGEVDAAGHPTGYGEWRDTHWHGEHLTGFWYGGIPTGPFRSRETGSASGFVNLRIAYFRNRGEALRKAACLPRLKPLQFGIVACEVSTSGAWFKSLPRLLELLPPVDIAEGLIAEEEAAIEEGRLVPALSYRGSVTAKARSARTYAPQPPSRFCTPRRSTYGGSEASSTGGTALSSRKQALHQATRDDGGGQQLRSRLAAASYPDAELRCQLQRAGGGAARGKHVVAAAGPSVATPDNVAAVSGGNFHDNTGQVHEASGVAVTAAPAAASGPTLTWALEQGNTPVLAAKLRNLDSAAETAAAATTSTATTAAATTTATGSTTTDATGNAPILIRFDANAATGTTSASAANAAPTSTRPGRSHSTAPVMISGSITSQLQRGLPRLSTLTRLKSVLSRRAPDGGFLEAGNAPPPFARERGAPPRNLNGFLKAEMSFQVPSLRHPGGGGGGGGGTTLRPASPIITTLQAVADEGTAAPPAPAVTAATAGVVFNGLGNVPRLVSMLMPLQPAQTTTVHRRVLLRKSAPAIGDQGAVARRRSSGDASGGAAKDGTERKNSRWGPGWGSETDVGLRHRHKVVAGAAGLPPSSSNSSSQRLRWRPRSGFRVGSSTKNSSSSSASSRIQHGRSSGSRRPQVSTPPAVGVASPSGPAAAAAAMAGAEDSDGPVHHRALISFIRSSQPFAVGGYVGDISVASGGLRGSSWPDGGAGSGGFARSAHGSLQPIGESRTSSHGLGSRPRTPTKGSRFGSMQALSGRSSNSQRDEPFQRRPRGGEKGAAGAFLDMDMQRREARPPPFRFTFDRPPEALLFVHGLGVDMHKALRHYAQMMALIGFPPYITPVLFSWPSSVPVAYFWARYRGAEPPETGLALAATVRALAADGFAGLHILVHSMGTRVLANALPHLEAILGEDGAAIATTAAAGNNGDTLSVGNTCNCSGGNDSSGSGTSGTRMKLRTVTICNPDFGLKCFVEDMGPRLRALCPHVTLYGDTADGALGLSEIVNALARPFVDAGAAIADVGNTVPALAASTAAVVQARTKSAANMASESAAELVGLAQGPRNSEGHATPPPDSPQPQLPLDDHVAASTDNPAQPSVTGQRRGWSRRTSWPHSSARAMQQQQQQQQQQQLKQISQPALRLVSENGVSTVHADLGEQDQRPLQQMARDASVVMCDTHSAAAVGAVTKLQTQLSSKSLAARESMSELPSPPPAPPAPAPSPPPPKSAQVPSPPQPSRRISLLPQLLLEIQPHQQQVHLPHQQQPQQQPQQQVHLPPHQQQVHLPPQPQPQQQPQQQPHLPPQPQPAELEIVEAMGGCSGDTSGTAKSATVLLTNVSAVATGAAETGEAAGPVQPNDGPPGSRQEGKEHGPMDHGAATSGSGSGGGDARTARGPVVDLSWWSERVVNYRRRLNTPPLYGWLEHSLGRRIYQVHDSTTGFPLDIDVIDMSYLSSNVNSIRHTHFALNREILDDLWELIVLDRRASQRKSRLEHVIGNVYSIAVAPSFISTRQL
ncbi:hypothetical protein Vretimale_13741 [Volvox reticuliferus]|uniref:Uncharacterized protein n=1 Tax=Volvox reticuliferus TaxID=1737510 RepID=A0A8J4GKU1_9CHLO|nr:hypothetical protein Vretimale_13741 [Volvox reticuliferus]